jgi:hypothetical protein
MSMRSDWQAAKAKAKTLNKNVEVKFPTSADLGPLLDKYEAAKKDFDKVRSGERDKAWAKSAEAYLAAVSAAGAAAKTYIAALPHLTATEEAREHLHNRLAYGLADVLVKANREGEKFKPSIKKIKEGH